MNEDIVKARQGFADVRTLVFQYGRTPTSDNETRLIERLTQLESDVVAALKRHPYDQ